MLDAKSPIFRDKPVDKLCRGGEPLCTNQLTSSTNEKAAEAQGLAAIEDRNNDQADSP